MSDREQMVLRQRVLANFGELALRSESLEEVLTEACRLVSEALGTRHAKVLEIEPGGRSLIMRAGIGWDPGIVGKLRLEMRDHSSETYSIRAGKPVITRDIRHEERFEVPPFLKDAGVVALANVPIFLPGGRPYGLLQVDSREPRDFSEEDTEFLRTYAAILGPVIDRLHKVTRLQTTEERFRLIVENARDYAILVTDAEDRITDWTPGAEAVFGWTAEEAIGQPSSLIFTPEDRTGRVDVDEAETARREGVAPNRRWHLRKDGSQVFIDGSVTALRGERGELRGFLKIGQDVTERRRTEEALRESEARFRHMADSAPALIWMTDADGAITFANMHYDHVFGRPASEILGRGWEQIILPEDLDGHDAAFLAAFHARAPFKAETRMRDREGRVVWLRCEGVPRMDDAGRFLGYTGCNVDITEARLAAEELERRVAERTAELMAAEETLRQAQKMEAVGQLTGGIAHDFNNMLQGVTGGLGMARRRVAEGQTGEALRYLDAVRDAAERAAGLTRRLLAFARRRPLEPKPVDTDGLVSGLADLIRRTVGPGITVDLRLRDGAGSVMCDPNEMESALLNLCINARDAMPEGGRLTIGTEDLRLSAADIPEDTAEPGLYVALSVVDSGTGMPPEVLERVFEPFFTTKPQGQGTGLGLSQVWSFAQQSGGLVRVESAPGRGTTVRLLLPLHARADAARRPETVAPEREGVGEVGTVLLVDDEDAARQPAADRLRELGHAVLEARDGPEALLILDTTRPDLLVTDVGLPNGMNGRQLANAARERVPGLPVLFISGYAGTSLPLGIDMIDKPFELDVLARRVRMALEADRRTSADRHRGA
ncbi:PAS domain S-box protein [Dankookia sp. GCM10030260]|uniref:PAS domain S-box protein n=1 Tax=Dankookia sp. GCM10030260 TaxID=3273390 RepID=UPI0036142987